MVGTHEGNHGFWRNGATSCRLRLSKLIGEQPMKAVFFVMILLTLSITSLRWIDVSVVTGTGTASTKTFIPSVSSRSPAAHSPVTLKTNDSSAESCPEYFRWIHEDLRPWKDTGITKEMVERGKDLAHVRIVVVKGRVYVSKYKPIYQTRDVGTIWAILQLLRLYPGRLPDLDIMFECADKPVIQKKDYGGSKAAEAPPMFHYCGTDSSLDIVFPDWSFWGWPEIHINPWETLRKELEEGKRRVKWMEREPYAYWKGNSKLGPVRRDLVKYCNVTDKQDWNARLYHLDWKLETKQGFKNTDLASQCSTHRYKIYAEGVSWSVSEKYILACDSMSLLITPKYHDFFTRSLLPTIHYWPVNNWDKCRSIKFAVDWGNSNPEKAQEIGKAGSKFIQEQLQMKYVYDYMFHVLRAYGKLLKYQPAVPEGAVEVCSETTACPDKGLKNKFKLDAMVTGPSDTSPCTLPPPYSSLALESFLRRKANLTKQVETWKATANIV